MRILVAMGLFGSGVARAGDVWVGGGASTGLQGVEGVGVSTVLSQVEIDAQGGNDTVSFRLDLDYHFDPFFLTDPAQNDGYEIKPHYPYPPETAYVQLGQDTLHLKLGVTAPAIGLQSWDEKDDYLPSYSNGWGVMGGQVLGGEPGITLGDGSEIFLFGGYDLSWLSPTVGGGFASEQDSWSTWSGVFVLPDPAYSYVLAVAAFEFYPADALWVTIEPQGGVAGGGALYGAELVGNISPETMVGGAVRAEYQHLSDDASATLGVPMPELAFSGALRADPKDWLHLALEGKESLPGGGGSAFFTGTFLVSVWTPEPEEPEAEE
jgi:hypothetical protein